MKRTSRRDPMNEDLPDLEIVESEVVDSEDPPDPATLGIDLPADKDEAIRLLLGELRDARSEAASYLDDLRRVAADFDNYRKRTTREQQATVERASERVLRAMLPVLDSFDAALLIPATTETEEKLLGGMRSTHAQLLDVLAKEGLESVPSWGEPFDPEIHEAVMSSGEGSKLTVSQELRRGYRLKGKVLRAALVALEASD
jgi:molecular chaperone GrpE